VNTIESEMQKKNKVEDNQQEKNRQRDPCFFGNMKETE
jgi:hypothetical protein